MEIGSRFNTEILDTLRSLHRAGFITSEEIAAADEACEQSALHPDTATIGYELEVTDSSVAETGFHTRPKSAEEIITGLGFSHRDDEVYEICSPPATHPRALHIATLGLVNARLIPRTPKGLVTEHISLGNVDSGSFNRDTLLALVGIARTLEMTNGSTAERMLQPANEAKASNNAYEPQAYAWNHKGRAGVLWERKASSLGWRGQSDRLEFRSLCYTEPASHFKTLDAAYYLTRALFDTQHDAHSAYNDFAQALGSFISSHALELSWRDGSYSSLSARCTMMSADEFSTYMLPFATMATSNNPKLHSIVKAAVLEIRDAYGLQEIHTSFESTS